MICHTLRPLLCEGSTECLNQDQCLLWRWGVRTGCTRSGGCTYCTRRLCPGIQETPVRPGVTPFLFIHSTWFVWGEEEFNVLQVVKVTEERMETPLIDPSIILREDDWGLHFYLSRRDYHESKRKRIERPNYGTRVVLTPIKGSPSFELLSVLQVEVRTDLT